MPLKEQQGPERATTDILEQMSSKDIANELTNYDWELFTAMHEVTRQTWHISRLTTVYKLIHTDEEIYTSDASSGLSSKSSLK